MNRGAGLLPRTRPHLRSGVLARALVVGERSRARRSALAARLAGLTEHPHVALAASGRGALLALLATARRPRALIPGYTCKAVVEAAQLAGVRVDLTDVSDGYNWAPEDVADAAGPDAVVVLTHQFGIAGRVEEVATAARDAGALVVEDCAGGLGGRSGGRRLGSFGDAAFYSFDMSKLVHVPPKGGALTVADSGWAARAEAWLRRETRPLGPVRKAVSLAQAALLARIGPRPYRLLHRALLSGRGRATTDTPELTLARNLFYDASFAEWQAAIALPQVERVDELAAGARRRYAAYRDGLADARTLTLPPPDESDEWAPIRFPILVRGDKLRFYEELLRRGVDCAFSFTYIARRDGLPRATALADAVLDLPFYPGLRPADVERAVAAVLDVDARWRG